MRKNAPATHSLAIYSGRDRLGSIVEIHHEFHAFGPSGNALGTFATRKLAVAAIDALSIAPQQRGERLTGGRGR